MGFFFTCLDEIFHQKQKAGTYKVPSEYTVKMAAVLYLTTTPGLERVFHTIVALLTTNGCSSFENQIPQTLNPKP
jgi:hypothetical protein